MTIKEGYKKSLIDGETYCFKNGSFARHLKKHGLDYCTYLIQYEQLMPQYCTCGVMCSFHMDTKNFRKTCGNRKCINTASSYAKSCFTEERWQQRNEVYNKTLNERYTPEQLKQMHYDMVVRTKLKNSYQNSVTQRRQTCFKKYGNPTYNNPKQISLSKQAWSPERKALFLLRQYKSLGNMTLSEYRNMFNPKWKCKRKRTRVLKGHDMPDSNFTSFWLYKRQVQLLSEKNYNIHINTINPNNYKRGLPGNGVYQLDHIISIKKGFLENISPEQIADVSNLQMLPWRENISKGWKK